MSRINYPEGWGTQEDCDMLDAMFVTAREQGLWFYHGGLSGPLWFSPDELQAEQEKGKFIWGAVNWTLRPPEEYVAQLDEQIATLRKLREILIKRHGS